MQKLRIMATVTIFPPEEVIMWPPTSPVDPWEEQYLRFILARVKRWISPYEKDNTMCQIQLHKPQLQQNQKKNSICGDFKIKIKG